jgi:hypothetical protein
VDGAPERHQRYLCTIASVLKGKELTITKSDTSVSKGRKLASRKITGVMASKGSKVIIEY